MSTVCICECCEYHVRVSAMHVCEHHEYVSTMCVSAMYLSTVCECRVSTMCVSAVCV